MTNGWDSRPFEECIEPVAYSKKIQRKDFLQVGKFPVVSQEDGLINGYWDDETDLIEVKRPLVVFGDHTKAIKYIDFDFVLGADGVKVLLPKEVFDPKFFFYQLQSIKLPALGYARHYRLLRDLSLTIPPLPEQHRIVAILDEAFAAIAIARANADQNRKNAREVFDRRLESIFTQAFARDEVVALADLATDITDGDHLPPPKAEQGIPFITIGNIVKDTRTIDFEHTFKVPQSYFDKLKPNRKPRLGDVLYTVTGSFGIPVLVAGELSFCFQRHIGLIRPKAGIDSQWLQHLLMSPQLYRQAEQGATGAAQKTVALKTLRGFKVPRTSLQRQKEDSETLCSLASETHHLESLYTRKLAALDELKQSLLQQAFSGAL